MPNSDSPISNDVRNDPARLRSVKIRVGSNGCAVRFSMRTNATSRTTAAISRLIVLPRPSRSRWPW